MLIFTINRKGIFLLTILDNYYVNIFQILFLKMMFIAPELVKEIYTILFVLGKVEFIMI